MMIHRAALPVALVAAALAASGCESFLEVENPEYIETSVIDPVAEAETFSLSAQTSLFNAFDDVIVYGAWFSGEAWVDDSFTTRQDIARRVVTDRNGTMNSEVYTPLARAITSAEEVGDMLKGSPRERSISAARAALAAGYGIQLMAETFCQGVIRVGAPLTPAQTSDEAIKRFQTAIEIGQGVKANDIVNAAHVGLARAYLQKGDFASASAAALKVPTSFVYNATKADDPSNRTRLGNTVFYWNTTRLSLVVPPYFRDLKDPRVASHLVLNSSGKAVTGQGGKLQFHRQMKYLSWGAPIRLASGLEARYIHAEAQLKLGNPAPAQTLVTERRATAPGAATGKSFASGDPVLVDLLDQKARDFYLEGHHLGAWRRNGAANPYVPPTGSSFYLPHITDPYGNDTCLPIPAEEKDHNPNFPKS